MRQKASMNPNKNRATGALIIVKSETRGLNDLKEKRATGALNKCKHGQAWLTKGRRNSKSVKKKSGTQVPK